MSDVGLNILLAARDTNVAGVVGGVSKSLMSLGSGNVVAAIAGVGVVVAGIGIATTKMAGDFEQGTTLLITSAGEARSNIGLVSQGILKMAVDTGTSTDQLLKGMFNIESAGFRGRDALLVESAAARGARVEGSDLVATTDVLTTSMHNYHLGASKAVDTMNSFRMAAAAGKMHMDDLTGALRNVLPIASMAGVKLTDVEAALSTMSNAGDKGAAAGTHLSQMLTYLLAPSKKATGVLTEVGLTTQKIADQMKVSLPSAVSMITDAVGKKFPAGSAKYIAALSAIVGGNKSMKAMLELTGESFKEFSKDASDLAPTMKANATAIDGFADVQNNLNFRMSQLREVVETLGISLGTKLLPFVTQVASAALPIVSSFGQWVASSNAVSDSVTWLHNNTQILIPVLTAVSAIILASVVPAVWSAAVAVVAATWPIIAFGLAIAGITFAFVKLYQNNAQFKAFVDGIAHTIQGIPGIVSNAMGQMQRQATQHTLQMKLQTNQHTLQMARQNVANIGQQADQIALLIEHTRDIHTRKMLMMKLEALQLSEQQAKGVVKNIENQRQGIQNQLDQLNPVARMHSLQMKDDALKASKEQVQGTIENIRQQRVDIETLMLHTHSASTRHMLGMKLDALKHSEQQAQGVLKNVDKQQKGVESSMAKLRTQMNADNSNILMKALHAWDAIRNGIGGAIKTVMPILKSIGEFLKSTFMPVWQQLVDTFNSQLKPAWNDLVKAMQPIMPQLQLFAKFIGGTLLLVLGILIGIIGGVIKAAANFVGGMIIAFGGIVKIISGALKAAGDTISFFVDLCTGHFNKLGGDLGVIFGGIGRMFSGVWDVIKGLFQAAIGTVIGFVQGFITSVTGYFTHLADVLVGHSIVPDMINAIIKWFLNLGPQALSAVQSMGSSIMGAFSSIASQATTWGSNIVSNLISGIQSMIGAAGKVAGDVMASIAAHLKPGSPTKAGIGMTLMTWGPNIVKHVADGIAANTHLMETAANTAMSGAYEAFSRHKGHGGGHGGHKGVTNVAPSSYTGTGQSLLNLFGKDITTNTQKAHNDAEKILSALMKAMHTDSETILKLHLSGNRIQEKQLRAKLNMESAQFRLYKDMLKDYGLHFDVNNPNNPINFEYQKKRRGLGTVKAPGGGTLSSSGGYGSSGGSTTYITVNYQDRYEFVLPKGTTRQQAEEIYQFIQEKQNKDFRRQGNYSTTSSGSGGI